MSILDIFDRPKFRPLKDGERPGETRRKVGGGFDLSGLPWPLILLIVVSGLCFAPYAVSAFAAPPSPTPTVIVDMSATPSPTATQTSTPTPQMTLEEWAIPTSTPHEQTPNAPSTPTPAAPLINDQPQPATQPPQVITQIVERVVEKPVVQVQRINVPVEVTRVVYAPTPAPIIITQIVPVVQVITITEVVTVTVFITETQPITNTPTITATAFIYLPLIVR